MKRFRLLEANEIECRVSTVSEKGVTLLLYKTARTDADILDETVGAENWENDFKLVDGVLYGGIGVNYSGNGLVWKWDAGTESNTEAEKGRASDAFKRAGFKHGIGRELYSAPFTFIPAAKCNIKEGRNGKLACYDNFTVSDIQYTDERVSYLCVTLKGVTVFEWGEPRHTDKIVCECCGKPIRDGQKKDGSVWPAENISAYTKRKYGKALCVECATNEAGQRTA